MSDYVIQVDATHTNVHKLPTNLIAVMGYDTGTPDIDWTAEDWARFPLAGKVIVDQSPGLSSFAIGKANLADVERGAATVGNYIEAAKNRMKLGLQSPIYISFDPLAEALNEISHAGIIGIRMFVANYGWSLQEALRYLWDTPQAVGVQFASPGSNPNTLLPGSLLTLKEANADLSVKRATWFGSPYPAATAWSE